MLGEETLLKECTQDNRASMKQLVHGAQQYLGYSGTQMACSLLQTGAEDARFECARKMTELESRKRYEFLEAMVSSMDAHLRFFERGHEVTPETRHQLTVL